MPCGRERGGGGWLTLCWDLIAKLSDQTCIGAIMRKQSSPKPGIAAALIVRDEARSIARCLDSLRPHVDRLVVLDTGSTDGTQAIAAAGGAEVHERPWPDDFSVARNQVLELANADWNLVLDADEWIMSGGEQLRELCKAPDWLGKICVHSAMDGKEASGSERRNWITRLLPRGVRYAGRVHEQPVSALPRARIELHVAHDGYLADQLSRKTGRNRPLLMRELADRPGDPYILYQLGKDDESQDDFASASAHYEAAFAATGPRANWRHGLIVRHLHCLGKVGRRDDALRIAEAEMASWAESPDFFFVVGNLALDQALDRPEQALDVWLPLAAFAWERCLAIGERPDLECSMRGCGSDLARHNLDAVRTQMALYEARAELERLCG
jgi:glycosyltransferase involved in cell wall biosynthesis